MKNYIKPTANVIEMAVRECLSAGPRRVRVRTYSINGNSKDIQTNLYTSSSISKVRFSDEGQS